MTGFAKYRIGKVRLRDIDPGDTPLMKGDERDRRERLDGGTRCNPQSPAT